MSPIKAQSSTPVELDRDFEALRSTWSQLGKDDPLWAVVSHDDKRGNRWGLDEFLATGESDVDKFHTLLREHAGAPQHWGSVLDFGCGVGRLVYAWSKRATEVVGVDISAPMIEKGRQILAGIRNARLLLNERHDLSCFESDCFDLVESHICLQHMPWTIASGYVREFGRVCKRGGIVVFQLPARNLNRSLASAVRKKLVDLLPLDLGQRYRKWRHGSEVVFSMYFTKPESVLNVASSAHLELLWKEPDLAAGPATEGYIYIFRSAKPISAIKESG